MRASDYAALAGTAEAIAGLSHHEARMTGRGEIRVSEV